MTLSQIWKTLQIKMAAGEILGGPSMEVKQELIKDGWSFKPYWHMPAGQMPVCVDEAISPEGISAFDDDETRDRYNKLCRAAAERLYRPG